MGMGHPSVVVVHRLWVFTASAATFRGSRTRYWHSAHRHEGRKLMGIMRGDTSISLGIKPK